MTSNKHIDTAGDGTHSFVPSSETNSGYSRYITPTVKFVFN